MRVSRLASLAVSFGVATVLGTTCLLSCGGSPATQRSWDLILTPTEVGAVLDRGKSSDTDYFTSSALELRSGMQISSRDFDSKSEHLFRKDFSGGEVETSTIKLLLARSVEAARQLIASTHAGFLSKPPGGENPFLSEEVSIPKLGDDSFAYRWSSFAPVIVLRVGNAVIEVETHTEVPRRNVSYSTQGNFAVSLGLAREQEAKLIGTTRR